ncbi:MAG: phycocyanin alpha phycocyanobilin lyase [Dehalococcoidia bacterium]|nr:MAG: phycocyanin alpha phycocyanobilin lyase [Dehalococcoidia bacterium]
MSSPLEQYLAELRDLSKPMAISKLANLSDLLAEEADIFRREWPNIDVTRRKQIVGQLAELAEDNLELDFDEVFRSCLTDADGEVRVKAIEGLWGCEERSLIDPLIRLLLEDVEHSVRAAAADGLGRFTMLAELGRLPESDAHRVEEALLTAFNKGNEQLNVRLRVLEAISPLTKPQVEEMIRQAYRSDSLEFQVSAVYAMGRNCNPGWLPVLLKELRSPDPQLRFEAVRACAELEAEEAVPHLIELTCDSDAEVQISAIEALGRIGGGEAREGLQRCLDSSEEVVRQASQEALEEIGFWEDPSSLS